MTHIYPGGGEHTTIGARVYQSHDGFQIRKSLKSHAGANWGTDTESLGVQKFGVCPPIELCSPIVKFSRFIVHFMLLTAVPKAMIEPHGRAALHHSTIVWRPGFSAPPCGRNWLYDSALAQ